MSNPFIEHYNYLNNLQCYVLKIKDLGLDLTLESFQSANAINTIYNSINLIGVSNTDQGGNIDSRKSTTENIFLLNNNKDNFNNNIAISQISKL